MEQKNQAQGPQRLSPENTIASSNITFCDRCGYNNCQCERLAAERAETERKAKEVAEARKAALMANLGGRRAYEQFTLANFRQKDIVRKAQSLYPAKNLFIKGPTGCGKTHLAVALVREMSNALLIKPPDIYRRLRGLENSKDETKALLDLARRPLIIDDLGVEKLTEFAAQIMYELIDRRWMDMAGGLIITSNLAYSDLAAWLGGDRIVSRLAGMCEYFPLDGEDMRLAGKV